MADSSQGPSTCQTVNTNEAGDSSQALTSESKPLGDNPSAAAASKAVSCNKVTDSKTKAGKPRASKVELPVSRQEQTTHVSRYGQTHKSTPYDV